MQGLSATPVVEGLEQRVLLSVSTASAASAPLRVDAHTLSPLKKTKNSEGDQGEDDNGNGNGKAKGKKAKPPEITVLLNNAALADGSASVDFGRVTLGDAGPTRTFVIRNDGRGPLSIGSVSLPAGFSLLDAPAAGLDAGDTTTFTVRLDTASAATRSGTIRFATNDADENPFDFTLKGTIAAPPAPELTLLQGSRAIAYNGSIDFGTVSAGSAGATRTLTIRNDGSAPLTLARFRLPAGFSLVDAPAASLAPHESDTVTIRLNATAAGAKSGVMTFRTNDADEGYFQVRLTGTVTTQPATPPPVVTPPPAAKAPMISVWLSRPGRSSLNIADGSLDAVPWPKAVVGGRAPARTFVVANEGAATLTLGALQLPAGFRVVDGLAASIAPGASDTITVALDTAVAASRHGQISFTTNDARASVFNFSVAGNVAAPALTPSTVGLTGTTLVVNGTAGDDVIVVSGKSRAVYATINGKPMAGSPFAGVTKVVVNGGAGNDSIDLSRLFVNATANGGVGNDTITGSPGNDVLNGEAGNDVLNGGPGDDNLLGGDGADILTGDAGVDAFHGESGNDTLNAVDGIADALLDPGGGNDLLHRDRVDPGAV